MDQQENEPITSDLDNGIGRHLEKVIERVLAAPVVSDDYEANQEEQARLRRRDKNVSDFLDSCGKRMATCRISNFKVHTAYQQKVLGAVKDWIASFEDHVSRGEGLVLYGPVGTGKDHLAIAAVGNVVFYHGQTAHWVNGRELFAECRERIGQNESEQNFISTLVRPDILIISDPVPTIGDLTQYQSDTLYRICDKRYGRGSITVVTLNVANDEEADRRLGAATWDRLCHGALKIACMWPTHRKPGTEITPS